MKVLGYSVLLVMWGCCIAQGKACDYPEIEGGKLHSWYYNTHTSRYFPMEKGRRIDFSCNDGFLTASGQQWGSITCTADGWDPTPKCFRTCSIIYYDNMHIQYEYSRYAVGSTETYRCHQGFTNPEGHEHGTIECLPSGKFSEAVCSRTCTLTATNMETYKPKRTLFKDQEILQYECGDGYKTPRNNTVEKAQCTQGRWKNTPRCEEITCSLPSARGYQRSRTSGTFKNGDVENVRCEEGYTLRGAEQIQCYYFGWYPQPPSCEDNRYSSDDVPPPTKSPYTNLARGQCPQPPKLDNTIEFDPEPAYNRGDTVKYECRTNYTLYGSQTITCEQGRWTSPPQCIEEEDQPCGPAPFIANGDFDGSPKTTYKSGTYVDYKCQSYYTLEGPQRVNCRNGGWSTLPECLEPCTVSPQEMAANNIQLRWVSDDKLYIKHNEFAEFECKSGNYIKDESASSFRPQCNRGKLEYPKCIKQGSCVTSLMEMEENNLILERENTEVSNGEIIEFTCKPGFYSMSVRAMKVACKNGKLNYPQCGSRACLLSQERIEELHLELLPTSGNIKYVENGKMVEFRCKDQFRKHRRSSDMTQICEEGLIAYPTCVPISL